MPGSLWDITDPVGYFGKNVFGYDAYGNGQTPAGWVGNPIRSGIGEDKWGEYWGKIKKFIDPQGFGEQYNPFGTDEDKYGKPPPEFDWGGGGGGGSGGGLGGGGLDFGSGDYSDAMNRYRNQMNELNAPVDLGSPYMQQLMQMAGGGAMQDAKSRGLGGSPYSIGANEKARYMAGLDYMQKEQARRQQLRADLLKGYGTEANTMYGNQTTRGLGAGNLAEQQRQHDLDMKYKLWQAQQDAYNRRVMGHNAPLQMIPFVGPAAYSSANGKNQSGGY